MLEEERKKGYKFLVRKNIARWFVFLLIGMFTALVACVIDISIEELSHIKYAKLSSCILLQISTYTFRNVQKAFLNASYRCRQICHSRSTVYTIFLLGFIQYYPSFHWFSTSSLRRTNCCRQWYSSGKMLPKWR